MLYYHGTTQKAAEAIQREGLKPHRETAYQVKSAWAGDDLRTAPGEDEQVIYITKHKALAEKFAVFRAQYEMAQPGDLIPWEVNNGQFKSMSAESCDCIEYPVVLTLDIPMEIEALLEGDVQDDRAVVCACVIGPKHIVKVEEARPNDEDVEATAEESRMYQAATRKRMPNRYDDLFSEFLQQLVNGQAEEENE